MTSRGLRSDSSSSSLTRQPTSPIPSSVDALPRETRSIADAMTSKSNGSATGPAQTATSPSSGNAAAKERDERHSIPTRARSASFQKGVAVLRALARAPEDEVDSGYEEEGREARPGRMPGPDTAEIEDSGRDRLTSPEGLSEEAKQAGRRNREGLRKRREDKEVSRIVGGTKAASAGEASRREKRKSKSWEIPRKVFHSSIGFIVLTLYVSKTDLKVIVRNLSYFLGVVVTADVIRLNLSSFESLYEKVLGFLMRESEKTKVNGVVWYLVGVLFCLHFLPEDIACVSIMILSWADTAASVFGRLFGQYTPPLPSPPFAARKSLAGTLAASTVATLTAVLFWATPIAQLGRRTPIATEGRNSIPLSLLCIGSGIVAGVAEGLELGGVDDNLSLPILSAIGIKAVVWAWNYFFA